MDVIIKTFTLSSSVTFRMIRPILGILIASIIISALLNIVTAGYANYVIGPITAAFISLFGIRTALSILGDNRPPMYEMMILYAVMYGLFFIIAKGVVLQLPGVIYALYENWNLNGVISIWSFLEADRLLHRGLSLRHFREEAILLFVLFTSIYVVMAVPMANAARAAGQGSPSTSFFNGFGRSFIPLFCIFSITFVLQFFFGFLASLYALVPIVLSIVSFVISFTIPIPDLDTVVNGVVASIALLWLHSLVWSASAVALKKRDEISGPVRPVKAPPPAEKPDLRALRKSRE